MDDIAVKVDKVSKTFKLPHEKHNSVKSLFVNLFRGRRTYEKQDVLNDVSFDIKKGEFFGIVGRNGSGKSTLLKLIAGIYTPDKGSIHVNGKLTPFIELGVGFNPELTGRENVFLNGALLGFNRKEMVSMYQDIVDFAEIDHFMDQKLKNYSSGMQVRLAFSIAIRAQSSILLLDEVLAVGDAAFQQKCFDVFEKYKATKQTVVLVTHDMDAVKRFCNRAMLINNGAIELIGTPEKVAENYTSINDEAQDLIIKQRNSMTKSEDLIELKISNEIKKTSIRFSPGDQLNITIKWPKEVEPKNIGVGIVKNTGEFMYGSNTFTEKRSIRSSPATFSVKLDLGPGKYHLVAGLFGKTNSDVLAYRENGPEFIIETDNNPSIAGLIRLNGAWK